jgi:hypothetical protein
MIACGTDGAWWCSYACKEARAHVATEAGGGTVSTEAMRLVSGPAFVSAGARGSDGAGDEETMPKDPPSDLCPSCTQRWREARAAGQLGIAICQDCSDRHAAAEAAREAAEAEAVPAEHPAPWRWVPRSLAGDPGELVDARGDQVVRVDGDEVGPASPLARELLRLAPETAGLLRDLEWINDGPGDFCPCCQGCKPGSRDQADRERAGHAPDCRLAAILAALDAARETAT